VVKFYFREELVGNFYVKLLTVSRRTPGKTSFLAQVTTNRAGGRTPRTSRSGASRMLRGLMLRTTQFPTSTTKLV